jgi:pimeloyl-ACP methyl ester carboxylesterase
VTAERTHFGITSDGVRIGGTVHGEGPPIVFWHGAYGDGDLDWRNLLPHLADRFTCFLPSWRGRGLSEDHRDVSYDRRIADIVDYVATVGEPTGLVGWSGRANPALAAAGQSDAISAVALYEPTIGSVMDDQERQAFGGAVARMTELASDGQLTEAVRAAASFPFNEEEVAVADAAGYFVSAGPYVPNLLNVFQQLREHQGPTVDDPSVLASISTPILVVHGAATKPFWVRSAQHVATHVPGSIIRSLTNAGHAGPITHPATLAETLSKFLPSPEPSHA